MNATRRYEFALALRERVKPKPWYSHKPHPKQAEFLANNERDVLFGGAAGGGKSDALLMAALQYVDVPGYSALVVRRTFKDLNQPGAIMDRAQEWLRGTSAKWNNNDHRFTFPSGAVLTFGYLDSRRDIDQYQGAEYQFAGVDELTQMPEQWARYLFSRLRKPKEGPLAKVPLRFRGATNPGGIGHEWVRKRYVDKTTRTGTFIPSFLEDNPSLDRNEYLQSLAELDATTRAQLRDGVWVRSDGGLVYRYNSDTIWAHDVVRDGAWKYLLAEDYGFTDALAKVVYGWRPHDPVAYVVHVEKHEKMTPTESAERTRELETKYKFTTIVGDMGGLGKGYIEEARRRYGLPIEAAEKNNKLGYVKLMNDAVNEGRVRLLVGSYGEVLLREWDELPWADDGRTAEAPGFDNHAADAALYGWRRVSAYCAKPVAVTAHVSPEVWATASEQKEIDALDKPKKRGAWLSRMAHKQ